MENYIFGYYTYLLFLLHNNGSFLSSYQWLDKSLKTLPRRKIGYKATNPLIKQLITKNLTPPKFEESVWMPKEMNQGKIYHGGEVSGSMDQAGGFVPRLSSQHPIQVG